MKQIIPALCRRSPLAIVVVGSSLVPGQNKAGSGTTSDIPGAQPKIHLVAPVADGQWTMPAGDYGNTRYSPLDQINITNIIDLTKPGLPAKWTFNPNPDNRAVGIACCDIVNRGAKLPLKQIWELVAYIKSLGTAQEPDLPQEPADETEANPQHYDSTNPGTPIFIVGSTK